MHLVSFYYCSFGVVLCLARTKCIDLLVLQTEGFVDFVENIHLGTQSCAIQSPDFDETSLGV